MSKAEVYKPKTELEDLFQIVVVLLVVFMGPIIIIIISIAGSVLKYF